MRKTPLVKSKETCSIDRCYSPAKKLDSSTLEIAKIDFLPNAKAPLYSADPECNCMLKNIPFGVNFFYIVEQFDPDGSENLLYFERGMGELIKIDGRPMLDRQFVFSYSFSYDQHANRIPENNVPPELPEYVDFCLVHSYVPKEYVELLCMDHAVVCSIDKFTPSITPLEEKTLLGRLDGRIQSIDKDELKFILGDNIKIAVEESKEPLRLQTNELSLNGKNSIIMTNQVHFSGRKTRPRRFNAGSMYFNEKKKTFEYYDGENWKTLVTE